ncbi:hypothetical protein EUS_19510 [[Eubacterium] siraeum 70/3]|jgi:hypothetical protein|uniref:Uncharacterized protein n=1 Tax=[Eubacterium] siraeum 70/3 TaxID=657319 RepID=D4JV80_9FIRM|nr:hypothetical protein EUS_19510 [[Eubacterium] siraeum 70/3]
MSFTLLILAYSFERGMSSFIIQHQGGWFLQPFSLFNAAQILALLLLLLSSIAVTAAVPYLNYNTKPLFFNGKNSFLPKEEKTAARKRKSRTRSYPLCG